MLLVYVTLRIPLNMNFFHPHVTQIKEDLSETDSFTVHRRYDMEAPTPPDLTQRRTVSSGVND